MDHHSLKALDFYHLLDILKEYATSPLGRKRCEALRPSSDVPTIQSRMAEVLELKGVLESAGPPPIRGLRELDGILQKLDIANSVLTVQELMDLCHQIVLSGGMKRFFERLEGVEAPRLQEKALRLASLKSLEKEILRAIDPKGEILDDASPGLSDIRHRIRAVREKAKGALEHLLHQEEMQPLVQEQLITLRNGRYVLPIKSDYKHRLQGIVHDQSQSRMTLFFEPLQVVGLNNEINLLVGEEREEEYRILADLSEKARRVIQDLRSDYEILGEFDLLHAMATFSLRWKGVRPTLKEDGTIDMKEAKHPLLLLQKGERVVPVHLRMGEGIRTLILSGANAGGKTVALKTLGLLTLMVQCGLLIPVAEGSQVSIFQEIFAVIGDEQNLEENLSTFSSHLLHLNQVLEKAGPRSLILLDELGVGTHASEGCALAMGFLDQLRQTGATLVVTTHFDGLKVYGYLHADVENVAVAFDEETLEPKYSLSYGSSGLSNAFLIAEKLGVSQAVLQKAHHYHDGGEQEVARTLVKLEELKAEAERERQGLLETKAKAERDRQRLKDLLDGIKKRRQEIFDRAEERAKKAGQTVEEELKEWVRRQKEERKNLSKQSSPRSPRREIQEIKEKAFPPLKRKGTAGVASRLSIGDRVRVEPLRSHGTLLKVEEPSKRVEVITDRSKVWASMDDLVRVSDEEEKGTTPSPRSLGRSKEEAQEVPSQLNVIGLTIEDALPRVDRFIDQALLHGLEKIQIIHGIGSGRLRSAIGSYLRGHRGVKSFGLEDSVKGRGAVTLVELV